MVASPIYHPTNSAHGFPFLHILAKCILEVCLVLISSSNCFHSIYHLLIIPYLCVFL